MRIITLFLFFLISLSTKAEEIAMADQMRSSGKIYVVVGVLLIILIGLLLYLYSMDRKLSKLEKTIEIEK